MIFRSVTDSVTKKYIDTGDVSNWVITHIAKKIKQSKEWYNNNKEEKAKYYLDSIDKFKAYKTEKINCDCCGSVVGRASIAKPKTSTKCKTLNEKKTEII